MGAADPSLWGVLMGAGAALIYCGLVGWAFGWWRGK